MQSRQPSVVPAGLVALPVCASPRRHGVALKATELRPVVPSQGL